MFLADHGDDELAIFSHRETGHIRIDLNDHLFELDEDESERLLRMLTYSIGSFAEMRHSHEQ